MMKIEQTHADQVNVLTAELAHARWQVKIAEEMLRIITGGDREMIEIVRRQAVEAEIDGLAS
jgi:hypothetical protein